MVPLWVILNKKKCKKTWDDLSFYETGTAETDLKNAKNVKISIFAILFHEKKRFLFCTFLSPKIDFSKKYIKICQKF